MVHPQSFSPSTPQRYMKEGAGWRIGWDDTASCYKGLLGGATWALELTADEFQDFCRLARQLADTLRAMAPELMAEERITCEAESDGIWLEVEGFPEAYTLRFILTTGRQGEGQWDAAATREVIMALGQLTLF